MSQYIEKSALIKEMCRGCSMEPCEGLPDSEINKCYTKRAIEEASVADVVSREQYNELYEENLKLREEINNLAGEELPWVIVTVCPRNKGESPYRYHCPHCGYSHKKPSHYCSNCGRRCKE